MNRFITVYAGESELSAEFTAKNGDGHGFTLTRTHRRNGRVDLFAGPVVSNHENASAERHTTLAGECNSDPFSYVKVSAFDLTEQRDALDVDPDPRRFDDGTLLLYRCPRGRYVVAVVWQYLGITRVDSTTFYRGGTVELNGPGFEPTPGTELLAVVKMPQPTKTNSINP